MIYFLLLINYLLLVIWEQAIRRDGEPPIESPIEHGGFVSSAPEAPPLPRRI